MKTNHLFNIFFETLRRSILIGFLLFSATANSQILDPTLLPNFETAIKLHQKMETRFLKLNLREMRMGTECTARATVWAYDLYQTYDVVPFKVFVFYTHAYHRWYQARTGENFKWWFHTSAAVMALDKDKIPTELVVDASFSDRPLRIKEWTDLFIDSGQKCIENVPFAEFEGDVTGEGESYNPNAHCYVIRAPMMDKFPADADARERGIRTLETWDIRSVKRAALSLRPIPRAKFKARVGL